MPSRSPPLHPWTETLIIGAGAAGLAAARALTDAGRRVLVIEARDRIGGRIHTLRDGAKGGAIELGAEFIHGRPEPTWDLVEASGQVAVDVPFEHWRRRAGRLVKAEDYMGSIARVTRGLSHLGRDVSFAEYLRTGSHAGDRRSAQARRLATDFVEGFDAADPEELSAKSIARELAGIGDLENQPQARLLSGYSSLLDHLVCPHPDRPRRRRGRPITPRLGIRVCEIRWGPRGVRVRAYSALQRREILYSARRAIITLPLGVLEQQEGAPGSVRIVPDLPAPRRAMARLASGGVVKAVLVFSTRWWEEPGAIRAARAGADLREAVFMHEPGADFPTWWTSRPLRLPVLTGWAGGPRAMELAGLSTEKLAERAIASLASLFRRRPATIASELETAHIADWVADPFARGAYSYQRPGGGTARRELARPVESTLIFAGEATDTNGQASTVAGALASGRRAAQQVMAME